MVGDGPHSSSLKSLAKSLGITKSVTFTGRKLQEDLPEYYSAADVFLYSSSTDTIGINILEAMSAGLPVVAVKDPSTAEVVKHKNNGFLLPPKAKDFALAIKKLMSSKTTIIKMSKNCLATADKFIIRNTTKKLLNIYQKVIDR